MVERRDGPSWLRDDDDDDDLTIKITPNALVLQFFSKYPAMGIALYRWSVMA